MSSSFTVIPVLGMGAEDVVVATSGKDEGAVFTGTEDGSIWRVSPDGRQVDKVADTGGRPLGIEIDPDGRLVVCDAHRGLLRVDTDHGRGRVRRRQHRRHAGWCSATTQRSPPTGPSGSPTPPSTSASRSGSPSSSQDTRTGRLLRVGTDGTIEVVLDGLAFSNGVALSAAEDFVAVAESAAPHRRPTLA